MLSALRWVGRHGQLCLIAGLLAGLFLPDLAQSLAPFIGPLVAALLLVTGMRVGARKAFGSFDAMAPGLARIAALQLALPIIAALAVLALGLRDVPLALAVALMLAAPSLTGAPNFAIMMGADPAPGMRLVILGTALFPLTALPVLVLLDPTGGGPLNALSLSLGLMVAIILSASLGFAVRRAYPALGDMPAQSVLDGLAALLLGVVVVGLMNAIGPLLRETPLALLPWIATVFLVNAGLVFTTLAICRRAGIKDPLATAIFAGNRNIALFLIVLPPSVAAPLMIFVGCYQIPMYLTPVMLKRFAAPHVPQQ